MSAVLIAVPILGVATAVGLGTYLFSGNKSGSGSPQLLERYNDGNFLERPSEFGQGLKKHKKSGKHSHSSKKKGTKKHRK